MVEAASLMQEKSMLLSGIELRPPVLISSDLVRDFEAIPSEPVKESFTYHYKAKATIADEQHDTVMYQCSFSAGQAYDGRETFRADADYVLAIYRKEGIKSVDVLDVVEQLINFSAWARFRDLFAVIISQATVPAPLLPTEVEINMLSPEEFHDESE